jgi:hypothetical protein
MVVAVMAATGCAIDKQNAPALNGPSEYGLSLEVTATPDLIFPQEVSAIVVTTRDASGNPLPGVGLRFRLVPPSGGSLSTNNGVSNSNGQLTVTYFAPSSDTFATIEVTTVGTNGQVQRLRTVAIRVRS